MSDLQKDNENKEICLIESDDSSSEAEICDVTIPTLIQEIGEANTSKQLDDAVENKKVNETLQTKEIGQEGMTGALMPNESVQAPVNELPRNTKEEEDAALAARSQPAKRPRKSSKTGISINDTPTEVTLPRRSLRIKEQNDPTPTYEGLRAAYSFMGKRPLYLDKKKDEYAWFPENSSDDEEE